jgi:hypothetical protein
MTPPHKFSDFSEEERRLQGTKIKISDILNREILITGYNIRQSRYTKDTNGKEYLSMEFEVDGNKHIMFSGSDVLISQMKKYGDKIPFMATIIQNDKYYTLS